MRILCACVSEWQISAANSWVRCMPVLPASQAQDKSNFRLLVDRIAESLQGEFCWAPPPFDERFIAALAFEGFLPMANRVAGSHKHCLTPKLHRRRCIIDMGAAGARTTKKTRRAAETSAFRISIDQDFDAVVAGCIRQHGHSWLYPPLIAALRRMHAAGSVTPLGHADGGAQVRVHTVELVDIDGRLVAGEIGYSVGLVYTSMSGFSAADHAGSVQCAALGVMLQSKRLRYWDLGMSMAYKMRLGASNVTRQRFLTILRAVRDFPQERSIGMMPARASELLRPRCSRNDRVSRLPAPVSSADSEGSASIRECGEGQQRVEGTIVEVPNGLFLKVRWDGCEDTSVVRFEDVELAAISDATLRDMIKSSSPKVGKTLPKP